MRTIFNQNVFCWPVMWRQVKNLSLRSKYLLSSIEHSLSVGKPDVVAADSSGLGQKSLERDQEINRLKSHHVRQFVVLGSQLTANYLLILFLFFSKDSWVKV